MTFKEWYKKYYCYSDGEPEEAAWKYQQKIIDELEEELRSQNLGMTDQNRVVHSPEVDELNNHITEIIPEDLPDWAVEAFRSGNVWSCLTELINDAYHRGQEKEIDLETSEYLADRLERTLELIREGNVHMASAKLLADISALRVVPVENKK